MSSRSSPAPAPLTCLQDYLNQVSYRPRIKDIPSLNTELLERARNCIKHSRNNNDLLEFLGDRVLNLVCALIVEKASIGREHHQNVRQVICSNDTFARLAFYLRLHEHAKMDPSDTRELDEWNPLLSTPPPKSLADLFESYAGAVYLQHGWPKCQRWLQTLFAPIAAVATAEWWNSPVSTRNRSSTRYLPVETAIQRQVSAYLYYKRDFLTEHGKKSLSGLPPDTCFTFTKSGALHEPHCERMEVAIHLINMWICKIIIKYWPEYHQATSKAAHIASTITGLIVSDLSLSYLGYLLSLFTYFRKPEDPDAPPSKSKWIEPYIALSDTTRRQLSLALKATIGWYYHADPEAADAWGEAWLRPVVMRVHDILTERPGFTPVLPADAKPDSLERHAASLSGASSPPPSEPMPKTLCEFFDRMDLSSGPDSTASRDTSEKRRAPVIKLKTLAEPGLAVPSTEAESKPEPPAEAASTTASEKDGLAAMTRWLKKMGLGDEVKYSHQARGTSAPPDSAPAPPVVSSTLSSHEESGPTTGQEDAPAPVPAESTPVTVDSARPKLQSSETSEGIANLTNWLKKMGLGEEVRYAPSANRETPAAVTCSPSESLDSSTPSPDSLQRSKDAPSESARGSTPFPKAEVAGGDRPKWLPIGATTDNSRRSPPTSPPLPSSTASKDDNPTKVTKGKAAVVETPASFVPRQLRSPAVTVPAA